MSHFTHIKTRFQNLFYLDKALSKLNINYEKKRKVIDGSKSYQTNLVIPQSNGYNVEFSWNEQEYELIADLAFWKQSSPLETFIDKIQFKACLGENDTAIFKNKPTYYSRVNGIGQFEFKFLPYRPFKLFAIPNDYSKKYIGRKYYVEIAEKLSDKEYIYKCHVDGIDFIDQDTIIKTN